MSGMCATFLEGSALSASGRAGIRAATMSKPSSLRFKRTPRRNGQSRMAAF